MKTHPRISLTSFINLLFTFLSVFPFIVTLSHHISLLPIRHGVVFIFLSLLSSTVTLGHIPQHHLSLDVTNSASINIVAKLLAELPTNFSTVANLQSSLSNLFL